MGERIRTLTFINFFSRKNFFLILLATLLSGCIGITEVDPANSSRAKSNIALSGSNQAYIYPLNPSVLNGAFLTRPNFSGHLIPQFITDNNFLETKCNFTQFSPDIFNPTNSIPFKDVTNDECLLVLNDTNSTTTVLQSTNQSWVFDTDSDEFYQVNTFYHINEISKRFLESLSFAHKYVHLESSLNIPPATKHNFVDTQSYWLTENGFTKTLKAYSECEENLNASFSPAQDTLCFGYSSLNNFRAVQDPSIIYHEVGHALVKIMMNQRNVTNGVDPLTSLPIFEAHPFQSDLGELFYDEAGAINEGIADYFSYYMNQRTRVGEFFFSAVTSIARQQNPSLDIDYGNYRPIEEDEDEHSANVSTASGERLSYPKYLHYDPNQPEINTEDVHFAGSIITHYLVALTKDLKSSCSFDTTNTDEIHKQATNYVMLLINESLAEVGDLTAKGSDFFNHYDTGDNNQRDVYFTNLNRDASFLWTQVVNPPNYRRFFRIFGKNILHYISTGLCPQFTLDKSEQLLDEYGLLLFKSYEDRGNGVNSSSGTDEIYISYINKFLFPNKLFKPTNVNNTQVNENNRRNSILISKDFIEIDQESNTAFVIDGQTSIKNVLANLTFEGTNVTTTEGIAGPEYNNNNVKISPGEVVGLSLNLFNNSNSTMAGVQFLANDWDHMKLTDTTQLYTNKTSNRNGLNNGDITGGIATHSPCIFDDFPTASEGGVTDTSTTTAGNCAHITKTNTGIDESEVVSSISYPKYDLDSPQPICMVQYSDENETKWVSQDFYRSTELGLEDSDCLNNPSMSGNSFNGNECLMRILPGATQGVLGKIDPQSTWVDTIKTEAQPTFTFTPGQIILMEVNKWIKPGTKFNCRFRVRFTNCSDCFDEYKTGDPITNLKDFSDYEYAGNRPYKVLNFQFTVLD